MDIYQPVGNEAHEDAWDGEGGDVGRPNQHLNLSNQQAWKANLCQW